MDNTQICIAYTHTVAYVALGTATRAVRIICNWPVEIAAWFTNIRQRTPRMNALYPSSSAWKILQIASDTEKFRAMFHILTAFLSVCSSVTLRYCV